MLSAGRPAWLDRERRTARVAGVAALGSLFTTLAAVSVVPRAASGPREPSRVRDLLEFDAHRDAHLLSAGLRALSLLLILVVCAFLYGAAQRRDPRRRRLTLATGIAGPLLLVMTTALGFVALGDIAAEFSSSGPRTRPRADALADEASLLRVVSLVEIAAHIVFGVWVLVSSRDVMKVGLLPRALGIWGVVAGVMIMLLPVGDVLLAGWLGSIGVLALGWWPGGRPPSWETGIAEPEDDRMTLLAHKSSR